MLRIPGLRGLLWISAVIGKIREIMPFNIHHARTMIFGLGTDTITKAAMLHAFERRLELRVAGSQGLL